MYRALSGEMNRAQGQRFPFSNGNIASHSAISALTSGGPYLAVFFDFCGISLLAFRLLRVVKQVEAGEA